MSTPSFTRRGFLGMLGAGTAGWLAGGHAHGQEAGTDRPNILLILADDMGYSDLGCYGGEIDTPVLDGLAANGVRFTQFYNAARCCPTRASLLTGLYPHQAGMGGMVGRIPKPLQDRGPYQGYLNQQCVTLAEVLRDAGYATYMSGKWHVGEERPVWPVDRGFDRHYGLISGAMNYFNIELGKRKDVVRHFARDGEEFRPPADNFYATDAFTDEALAMLQDHPGKQPFFLYLAYNAPHWPLHAPDHLIRKYEGRYSQGWPAVRRERFERMKRLDLIPADCKLSPQDPRAADWESLSSEEKRVMDRKMAVYAAMVERMDENIGRVIAHLRRTGQLDNTVVMFLSDNGACHEGGPLGHNFRPDLTGPIGTERSYHSYGLSWSNASNTPFRLHKHWTHEGGIRTPFIVHWPQKLAEAAGDLRRQVGHIIDIMPTCTELAGATYPTQHHGQTIRPPEGISLIPFCASDSQVTRTLYWEHMGNRAIRSGKWKLVADGKKGPWELYDLESDPTELQSLIGSEGKRAAELTANWEKWVERVGVRTLNGG